MTDDYYLFVCRPGHQILPVPVAFDFAQQPEKAEILLKVRGSQWEMIRNQTKGIKVRPHGTFYSFRTFYIFQKGSTTLSYTAREGLASDGKRCLEKNEKLFKE